MIGRAPFFFGLAALFACRAAGSAQGLDTDPAYLHDALQKFIRQVKVPQREAMFTSKDKLREILENMGSLDAVKDQASASILEAKEDTSKGTP